MDVHNQSQVVVIAVPFPTQSHLNQLLQFSCLISSYNIPVYFAGSVTHIRQAKLRFSNKNRLTNSKIHFHEFPTPHFLSPEPNPSDKFPNHLLPSYEATLQLREPMVSFLHEISPTAKRVVVLHDYVMSYVVQDTTTLPNTETYVFNPISPFSFFFDRWESMGKPFPVEEAEGLPAPETSYVCGGIANFVSLQSESQKFTSGTIFNSCRSIEGKYIDYLTSEQIGGNKQVWAIGPLNQMVDTVYEDRDNNNSSSSSNSRHKCLEWLDKQAPRSVLYVTFGTTTSMKDEQIKELALGLEQSQQKFIWVFRNADKGNIFEGDSKRSELPEDYEERVKGVGLVIRDWAPQQEILGHLSVGGFMSHCGWNSCMESITMGVPILAWPMNSDQPRNAFLLTDILKIGLLVISQLEQQEEDLVTSSTIAKAIKRLMASKEGEEIRKRAEEVADVTQQAVKEGGVSRMELDSFIAHITR